MRSALLLAIPEMLAQPRWDEKAGILGGLAVKLPNDGAPKGAERIPA